jgi:nucleolar protein 14
MFYNVLFCSVRERFNYWFHVSLLLLCSYIKGLDYDPDRERAQLKKLKKRLKSEQKGAVRELRKDNYFLTAVKEKERIRQEQERAEKYGKAMAFLQEQESAFKSGQLGKGKKRRR